MEKKGLFLLVRDGNVCTCKNAERIFDGEHGGYLYFSCSSCHRVSIVDVKEAEEAEETIEAINKKPLEIKSRLVRNLLKLTK